jgi:hypothetical protein
MLDIAVAYNRYRFLGNEFLTWLWFTIDNNTEIFRQCDDQFVDISVGNRMVLENRLSNGKEHISIKGDAAGFEEALLALSKGAMITDIHLVYKSNTLTWMFAIKGESLSFSGLKLPETGLMESGEDMEGMVLEKIYLYEKPFDIIDKLYQQFLFIRLSDKWSSAIVPAIKKWIAQADRR